MKETSLTGAAETEDTLRVSARGGPIRHHHFVVARPKDGFPGLLRSFVDVLHQEDAWAVQGLKKAAEGAFYGAFIAGTIAGAWRFMPRLGWLKVMHFISQNDFGTAKY